MGNQRRLSETPVINGTQGGMGRIIVGKTTAIRARSGEAFLTINRFVKRTDNVDESSKPLLYNDAISWA